MHVLFQPLPHRTHSFDRKGLSGVTVLLLLTVSISAVAVVSSYSSLVFCYERKKVIIKWQDAIRLCQSPYLQELATISKLFFLKVDFVLNNSLNVTSVVVSEL